MIRHRLDHVERPRLRPEAADAMHAWVDAASADALAEPDEQRLLDRACEQVAFHTGARAHEVVLTSGATESVTRAVAGVLARSGGGHVICPTGERPSLLAAVRRHADEVTWVEPEPTGWVDHQRLIGEVRATTALICLAMADHRLGTLQPVDPLLAACRDRRIATLVDTSVAAGRLRLDQWATRPDLLVVDGRQLSGVPGIGALVVRRGIRIEADVVGPRGARDRRPGTPNVVGAIGLGAAAAALLPRALATEHRLRSELHERLARRLRADGLRIVEVDGATIALGVVVGATPANAAVDGLAHAGVAVEALDDHHLRCAAGQASTRTDVDAAAEALSTCVRPAKDTA